MTIPRARLARLLTLLLLLILAAATLFSRTPAPVRAATPATPSLANPDLACASCHQAIYASYQATPMARGSGPALAAFKPGAFTHKPSAIDFRVFLRDGLPTFAFSRLSPALSGAHTLEYFIGSGRHGRTYLFQQQGLWFELPINFYTHRQAWGMAPAFDDASSMPAVLPTDPNCLHCHASDVQPSLPSARNRFASVPFGQAGIGCSACHGDPSAHLAQKGEGPILNPAHLSPAKRDSICLQCHLEGDAVVYRPGRSLASFQPGQDLADTAVYFVRASQQAGGGRSASQYEALLRSACKRASGDGLTCTSCHDPHSTPSEATRVAFFRARCLACHTSPRMAAHHPDQPDCASCHMPSRPSADISHEQLTDHDIEARPLPRSTRSNRPGEALVPVGDFHPTPREYGLAYAQIAARGDAGNRQRALALLTRHSVAPTTGPTLAPSPGLASAPDPEVNVQLGFLLQLDGQTEAARSAYQSALQADPYQPSALTNLAVLDASSNRLPEAIQLLGRLVQADPSQTAPGLNLAFILCKLGHPTQALAILLHLQRFNPDDPQLRSLIERGVYAGQHCTLPS